MFHRRIAVIGEGPCSRRIASALRTIGLDAVETRGGRPAFDWSAPATWPGSIHGATALCIADLPPRSGDAAALAIMAADIGVEHVVYLSVPGSRGTLAAERSLRRAPLDHTIIRASRHAGESAIIDAAIAALCDSAHLNRTYVLPVMRRARPLVAELAPSFGSHTQFRVPV